MENSLSMGSKLWNIIETIVRAVLQMLFKIVHKELTEEVVTAFMQFVKFGIVGVSNTVISYVLYALSLLAFQKLGILPRADYLVAQVIAFVLSVLWSFYWNNKFVFTVGNGQKRNLLKALLKTYISYGFTGIILNNILSWLWITQFSISKLIAPLINLIISVSLNFVINKFWAFKAE